MTGRKWLEGVRLQMRRARHSDPDLYESLLIARDLLLEQVAAGDVDLSLPLYVTERSGAWTFTNKQQLGAQQ